MTCENILFPAPTLLLLPKVRYIYIFFKPKYLKNKRKRSQKHPPGAVRQVPAGPALSLSVHLPTGLPASSPSGSSPGLGLGLGKQEAQSS